MYGPGDPPCISIPQKPDIYKGFSPHPPNF